MNLPRAIEIEVGAHESAATTFARDQLLLLRCADDAVARARIWRRRESGLLLGRFHRADPASCAWADAKEGGGDTVQCGLSRRLSGGRIVPVGPGVVCITMAVPVVDWLDFSLREPRPEQVIKRALRPEQVLNRALRPLLALLRGDGVDAFYAGRDLVTVGGRAVAHASFTVMRDGVAMVEMQVAESSSFAELAALLDRFDSSGIAGVDREALSAAMTLEEAGATVRSDDDWAERFAGLAATAFACAASVGGTASHGEPSLAASAAEAEQGGGITLAHQSAARDFLAEPGPVEDGYRTAAAVSMLGVVECAGRLDGDRLRGLRITGDLIAPFHTLEDIAAECEGEPLRPDTIRKALARALARPRSFLLGIRDLDELILRLG